MAILSAPRRYSAYVWRRIYSSIVAAYLRLRGVHVGAGCRFYGVPRIRRTRHSSIEIGPGSTIRSASRSNPFSRGNPTVLSTVSKGAVLAIASGVRMSDSTVVCADSIHIGDDSYVGVDTLITDTDAHPLCPACRAERVRATTAPVHVGAECFLGARSILLKGVTLADQTCVGAGSVVSAGGTVLSGLVAGMPAVQRRATTSCSEHVGPEASAE